MAFDLESFKELDEEQYLKYKHKERENIPPPQMWERNVYIYKAENSYKEVIEDGFFNKRALILNVHDLIIIMLPEGKTCLVITEIKDGVVKTFDLMSGYKWYFC